MEKIELSYVELLDMLRRSILSDAIPEHEKETILSHITALQESLWKYSA